MKPYSPETLAERWECSAEKVRLMCRDGTLASFRLGKLIRIPATEVERIECLNTASPNTEENGQSPSGMELTAAESRLVRQTVGLPKPLRASGGRDATQRQANG